jgi:PAS domain S-box-containing protein
MQPSSIEAGRRHPTHAQLLSLVEQASDGIFVADADNLCSYVNEAGCRLLGCEPDEIIGRRAIEFMRPEERDRLRRATEQMASGRVHLAEWDLRRKDGTWVPVEASMKLLGDGRWQALVRDISERRTAEAERQALSWQVDRLAHLVERAPEAVFVADAQGRYTYVNAAACRLLGYPRDELIGKSITDLIRPGETERLWQSRSRLLGGERGVEEWELRRADGTWVPVEITVNITPEGAWQAYVRDISERKAQEQAVRENEKLLESIFEILPVGVWIADRSGRIVRGNPAGQQIWAGARYVAVPQFGEYKGWWVDTGEPIAAEEWALARALRKGETSLGELVRIQCFDGSFKTIINSAAPLRDEAGAIAGAIVVNEDITGLQETQRKLRESEQLFRTVFNLIPVGLWVADRDGRIVLGNPAGERIWAGTRYVAPSQFGDYKAWWFETGKPLQPDEWGLARAIQRGETARDELLRIQCFDGSTKTVINWAAPIRSSGGEITGAIAVNEDVTSLCQTQDQLRRAVKDREDLLAVVSHDLRNPLGGLMMMAAALERQAQDMPGAQAVEQLAAKLQENVRAMSGLIDDLLAISVEAAGRSMLKLAPAGAGVLLKKAALSAKPLLERFSIGLEVRSPSELPTLSVDADRVQRIFANLIDNAVKFTDASGTVTLAAEVQPTAVRFSVANSGPPLPRATLESMFEPFWQSARDRRGAGLGLAICRSIVESHGGAIWAEPAPGQRVRVCFELPKAPG